MTRKTTDLQTTRKTVGPLYNDQTKTGNWDQSRNPVELIVLHTMVGYAAGADARFNDPVSNVSAHYGVLETGEIWQWVDEDATAYHAGDYAVNQKSIGIENEDLNNPNGVRPDVLYTSCAKLVANICKFYNFPCDTAHVKKHSEVSDTPTSCPDALDVDRIIKEANAIINPTPVPTTPVITDQTIVSTISDGDIEWQKARSIIEDRKNALTKDESQIAQMEIAENNLQTEIKNLTKELTDCQATKSVNIISIIKKILGIK